MTRADQRKVSVSREIAASPEEIFAVLTDTAGHVAIDGSGTVRETVQSQKLELGSKFGMRMRIGIPYRITNTVVEYEENRLIAWQHFGKHRWRFELEPRGDKTLVTETFDWSTSAMPKAIELMGYPTKHPPSMERTLERLDDYVTSPGDG